MPFILPFYPHLLKTKMDLQLQNICKVKVFLIAHQCSKCDGVSFVLKGKSRYTMLFNLQKPFSYTIPFDSQNRTVVCGQTTVLLRRSHWLKIKSRKQQRWDSSILVSSPVLVFLCIADYVPLLSRTVAASYMYG